MFFPHFHDHKNGTMMYDKALHMVTSIIQLSAFRKISNEYVELLMYSYDAIPLQSVTMNMQWNNEHAVLTE